ncbi:MULTISPECIES: hypothetical protein [unclassified Methanosarcina]|uniref:hypothetical protein n=1 Tax=unclassified Methanosarcina TaxID=2644672 RepID=UPI000616077C|nr:MULTISPECIES: hypothetical protein [unclassified Methanosarcina]AKB18258.1 hypothetical protein MSWHS_1395 [Methanosarcina sp. WWM596]AKB21582.1 hypothetical protein MSWH1_1311 [Methanosarcina sp. WH1]
MMENKRMILSVFIIGVILVIVGVETGAYFSDTEISKDNKFTAKVLDINISRSFNFDNVPPGLAKKESILIHNNPDSMESNDVYLEVIVTNREISDDTDAERDSEILLGITNEAGTNRGETEISKWIQVTKMRYNNTNILNLYTDLNGNDYVDLDDLNQIGRVKVNGNNKLSPDEVVYINMTLLFDPDSGNELQGDRAIVDEVITAM